MLLQSVRQPRRRTGVVPHFTCPGSGSLWARFHWRFHGIQVFDENGRYLDVIKVKGVAFGLAVHDANELIVVTNRPG